MLFRSCNQGNLASAYGGINGAWTVASTGTNNADANEFFVSAMENGNAAGACGSSCGADASLHVSNIAVPSLGLPADQGAAYNAGGLCPTFFCVATDKRAESPVINCSGQSTITLNFNYLEFGDGTNDDASLYYFDGAAWTLLTNLAKTTCCGGNCNGSLQGLWTAFTVPLPASANNNPNVKIGFRWVNNDDGVGTDPSFAVDDITLTVPGGALLPVPSFPLSGLACEGTSVALNGSATNSPTSWQWTVSPAGPIIQNPSLQNTSIVFPVANTYTVTLTVSNSAGTNSVSQTIVVSPEPTINVTPNPVSLCSGSSQNLTASGTTSFTWSPATGLSCTNCANPIASPTVNTTYTVIGTNGVCDDTLTVPITVSSSISASATAGSPSICLGGSTTLTATGGSSFAWIPDPSLSCTSCQSPVASPTVTTSYTVTVSSGSCPTATAVVTVTVSSAVPANIASTGTVICSGTSTNLTGTGGGTYSWAPATGLSCTNCANPVASPTATTTYTLSTVNGTCPTSTAVITISVTPATVAGASAASYTICNGQNTSLTATGGGTYSWSPATGLSCTNCANPIATPTSSTVYTVTVTNGSCLPALATVGITVNNCVPPVANYTASTATVCSGDCIVFTSTSTGNPTNFNWQFIGGSASPSTSSASSVEVCFFTPGTYTVQLSVSNSGGSNSISQTIFVAPNPIANVFPPLDTVIYGTSTTLTASPGDSIYSWSPAGTVSCPTCSLVSVSPTANTWYYCTQTNDYGCSATDSAYVVVDLQCGEIFVPSAFSPNGDLNNDVLRVRGNCQIGRAHV